jgi:hypothetical protein
VTGNDLFSNAPTTAATATEDLKSFASQPLAARMRPRSLDEFAGQKHVLAPGMLLRRAIEADRIQSLIFYGPPGTGKTSLANAQQIRAPQWRGVQRGRYAAGVGGGGQPPGKHRPIHHPVH